MTQRLAILFCAVPLLAISAGCDTLTGKSARSGAAIMVEPETASEAWKQVAREGDQDRLNRLGAAWRDALADARPRFARAIDSEGPLLDPRAAQQRPQPTPGSYNCRMISIGQGDPKTPAFQRFRPFFCYVLVDDEGVLTIVKQTGSQRPAGRLWEDDNPALMIFLGSLALGDEKEPLAYGDDPQRDMAGVFERIAPFRWRLVIPWPRNGAKLQVFELTPVANQPAG